jgi:hypothetical protein
MFYDIDHIEYICVSNDFLIDLALWHRRIGDESYFIAVESL